MLTRVYLILCGICLAVKFLWVLLPFFGETHTCRYTSLLLSNLCHDFMTYLVMSIIFFYIDPLLLFVSLIWLVRTVKKIEMYPKENIIIVFSWLITIGSFIQLVLVGYSS